MVKDWLTSARGRAVDGVVKELEENAVHPARIVQVVSQVAVAVDWLSPAGHGQLQGVLCARSGGLGPDLPCEFIGSRVLRFPVFRIKHREGHGNELL